jgi:hypothetical protein
MSPAPPGRPGASREAQTAGPPCGPCSPRRLVDMTELNRKPKLERAARNPCPKRREGKPILPEQFQYLQFEEVR